MHDPKRGPGHRTPLFDRMIDGEPDQLSETRPARILEEPESRQSVVRELVRLCNTRSAASLEEIEESGRHIGNYGIPDLSRFNPSSERDRERLARIFTRAIEAFEPRLRSPRVEVLRDPLRPLGLRLTVRAQMRLDRLWEPVSFPLTREDGDGSFVAREEAAAR